MGNADKLALRNKRVDDALAGREADCVPIAPMCQTYKYLHAGYTMKEVLYNTDKAKDAIRRYLNEYEPDMADGYGNEFCGQGPAMECLGTNWLEWAGKPGSSCPENSIHQYIEKPYLADDEYSELLGDYTGWIQRKYFPRAFKSLEPLANMDPRSSLGYGFLSGMLQYADGSILSAVEVMTKAGQYAAAVFADSAAFEGELLEMGYPILTGATTTVAYDMVSDTLRGTIGTMTDLMEDPETVFRVIGSFIPASIGAGIAQMQYSRGRFCFIPLHKGMDTFLSPSQYDEFYWPGLLALVNGLIDAGYTPYVYTEGPYDTRLERLAELPEHKCLVGFEHVDMAQAKRIVGAHNCISGGFSSRLLESGTKQQVIDEVKRLLDICAPGGGYIFDVNDTMDDCKPENIEAMFETVRDYGTYR